MIDSEGKEYINCIVGNIIGDHYFGENKEIRNGIKNLSAGTKVYCILKMRGSGHQSIQVFGLQRKSHRMIEIIIRTTYIKNFRVQKVYNPKIIEYFKKNNINNNHLDYHFMPNGLDYLNSQSIEIK